MFHDIAGTGAFPRILADLRHMTQQEAIEAAVVPVAAPWWVAGAVASAIISLAYLAIFFHITARVVQTSQWRANPLAVATAGIFFSCAIGHGLHAAHLVLPTFGYDVVVGMAARLHFADIHIWVWDAFTAMVAVYYWTLRNRFPALVRGSALFEDMRVREQQALEIHDNVVQDLARAKLAIELHREDEGLEALDKALANSRAIITNLLGKQQQADGPRGGELRRKEPAGGPR